MPKNDDRIILDDAYGNSTAYHFLGICEYKQKEYLILLPDQEEPVANAIAMLIVSDGENDSFYPVENPVEEQRIISTFRAQECGAKYPGDSRAAPLWRTLFPKPEKWYYGYLLSFFRVFLPILSLFLLQPYFGRIYIAPLYRILSPTTIAILLHLVHLLAIGFSDPRNHWRGWRYVLSVALLPTEISLFCFFAQHHFNIAVALFVAWLLGAIGVFIFRKPLAKWFVRRKYLLKDFALDLIVTTDNTHYGKDFPRISLRRYLAIAASVLMLVPSILVCCKYGLASVGHVQPMVTAAELNNADEDHTFKRLFADDWATISDDEKLEALQFVADIEAQWLGIKPVYVVPAKLDEITLGQHPRKSRFVVIDLEKESHLDVLTCINTILHECRHIYQDDCVQELDWSDPAVLTGVYYENARQWREDYAIRPPKGEEHFDEYYYQTIEVDAREYAQKRMAFYLHYMKFYASNEIGGDVDE